MIRWKPAANHFPATLIFLPCQILWRAGGFGNSEKAAFKSNGAHRESVYRLSENMNVLVENFCNIAGRTLVLVKPVCCDAGSMMAANARGR
jgi:hypothetical protein